MNLDEILDDAIAETCKEQGLDHASLAIKKFVSHYLTNEIPEAELPSKLQDIYTIIRD